MARGAPCITDLARGHSRAHGLRLANGLIRHEYLAVDLFFILSGFVLTHVHARELDRGVGARAYGRFLLLRLARVYPLHLVALACVLGLRVVVPIPTTTNTVGAFVTHLLLMASWGFNPGLSWNDPAWSLSSEWLAYLVLPLMILATATLRSVRAQVAALAALVALFGLVFFGFLLSPKLLFVVDMANGAGANARVLVGVALGSVLRRLYDGEIVRKLPWTVLFWVALPIAAACMTDLTGRRLDNSLWAYLAIMFILFAAARAPERALFPVSSRLPVYLGDISYAVYILHYPVLTALRLVAGSRLDALLKTASVAEARLFLLAAVGAVVGVSALAHHAVEKPIRERARRWIVRRYPLETA